MKAEYEKFNMFKVDVKKDTTKIVKVPALKKGKQIYVPISRLSKWRKGRLHIDEKHAIDAGIEELSSFLTAEEEYTASVKQQLRELRTLKKGIK